MVARCIQNGYPVDPEVERSDAEKRERRLLPMSLSLVSAIVLSAALMNVEADSLPYLDPPSPWWPSYSYAFREEDSILREQGEKLLLNNASPRPYGISVVIVLIDAEYARVRNARIKRGREYFLYAGGDEWREQRLRWVKSIWRKVHWNRRLSRGLLGSRS